MKVSEIQDFNKDPEVALNSPILKHSVGFRIEV